MKTAAALLLIAAVAGGCAEERVTSGDAALLEDIQLRASAVPAIGLVRIRNTTSRWDSNTWGDKLIFTDADVALEESIRGVLPAEFRLETIGGTMGDVTLVASHHPRLAPGMRALVFLGSRAGDLYEMPLGERSVVEVDSTDHVRGFGIRLADVRALAGAP
jgi:hypothetical protein